MQKTSSPQKGKIQEQKIVYKLSKNTFMKYRCQRTQQDVNTNNFLNHIKSLTNFFSRQSSQKSDQMRKSKESSNSKMEMNGQRLTLLFRLDYDSYLIGNNHQLDAISISTVDNYIETEQLWSFKLKSPILKILVDDRRKFIIAVITGQIIIYSYLGRKSKKPPQQEKIFRVVGQVKMIQLAKDSLLTVFFDNSVHSFIIDGPNSRQNFKKQYKVDKSLVLYQLAQCIQNTLNVFFWSPHKIIEKYFELWCMSIQITTQKLILGDVKKIYDIRVQFKDSLIIQSLTKDSYFMNLGTSIMMFRKGYYVDTVYINLSVEGTILKYFGDKKLIHISHKQIDFYSVLIDLVSNPPKLSIHSFDCINDIHNQKYQFFNAIKLEQHKIAFFYQAQFPNNSGQIKYTFALTQKIKYEDKIDSILPKISQYTGKYEGEEFKQLLNKIQISCDAVGKMGMTRKQAYLRIWRQSKKQQLEQFKLLLDTMDYNTIRQEILQKLRKKSMLLLEVHKIESGCLGMIHQNIFSSKNFTLQEFKNYLTSHFFLRKLELFKQIKLYEKKTNKIKLTESEAQKKDKLLINIQEYTNILKMDVKVYLLEIIYTFAKSKKDLKTQIRMVIRKFKFSLLFIYQNLLKQIVNIVKEDFLFLIKNIPELLPYQHLTIEDQEEIGLLSGLWSQFKQEEWEKALILENVQTVYNREMVLSFENNIWIKRNWLTHHDMIYLKKNEIKEHYCRMKGDSLFYMLMECIYDNYKSQSKLNDLIHFIEQTYIHFPHHLFNNVQLYRQLFLYFQSNQRITQCFSQFLKRKDQEIFKKIFDHEKFKKGSFLKEIKPIYQNLKQSDKFNIGLLQYFSSNISQVSDIKYLLNRINNEKRQFHAENQEMYQVLVKGMQIKLRLGSQNDIPIPQVLIYIENIPLNDDNPVSKQLKIIQKINDEGEKFKKMKLNMNVFQMIRNRDSVLISIISYQIQNLRLRNSQDEKFILETSKKIIEDLKRVRKNIYGPFQDNAILFIFIIKFLQTQALIKFVHRIIEQNTSFQCPFDNGHLQNAVFYCYRQYVMKEPIYQKSRPYLEKLVTLLPQDNHLRMFINYQLQLASIFSKDWEVKYPISGESGLISCYQLQGMLQHLNKGDLLRIDVVRVCQISSNMEKIVGESKINLYEVYEIYFMCLLQKGVLIQAINVAEKMIQNQKNNIYNIMYPIMIFKWVSHEFTQENKSLMISLMISLFKKPYQLIRFFKQLLSKSFSNQEKKHFLTENIHLHSAPPEERMKVDNLLFSQDIMEFLKANPNSCQSLVELLHNQSYHLIHSQQQFAKSINMLLYHLFIVMEPILLLKFIYLNRYTLDLKEVRSFLSHLCKYEVYDQIKLLQFSKRIFKVLYDLEKREADFNMSSQNVFSSPLEDIQSIEVFGISDNLKKITKSVERFKSKLKNKLNSSILKDKSAIGDPRQSKFQRISEYLVNTQKYLNRNDYCFNDSDGYLDKRQYLIMPKFIQGSQNQVFSFKKYLTWMFSRTNQQIQYYLLRSNEAEADEAIRKQEEALKLSFRKSPNEKSQKDNAKVICNAFNKLVRGDSENIQQQKKLLISSIPHIAPSSVLVDNFWTEQVEEVYLGSTVVKEEIIKSVRYDDENLTFDVRIIQKLGEIRQLQASIPEIIKDIYNDEIIDYTISTSLISSIYNLYPKITPINITFLEIYIKMEQLQKKLGLHLQLRLILPFEGLLLKQKDSAYLFNLIKNELVPHLSQNNIHTVSRIVSLSFKKPEFQQEVINLFFTIIVRQYDELENQFDSEMKFEKIVAFAQKMPLTHIKQQAEKLIQSIRSKQKRFKIIAGISDILRNRNDTKSADLLQSKWLGQKNIL